MPPKRQYSSTSSEEDGEEHAIFGKKVEKVEIEKAKRDLFEGQAARPTRAARPARAPVAAQPPVAVQPPVGSSTSSWGTPTRSSPRHRSVWGTPTPSSPRPLPAWGTPTPPSPRQSVPMTPLPLGGEQRFPQPPRAVPVLLTPSRATQAIGVVHQPIAG